jgi:hypothetical protein
MEILKKVTNLIFGEDWTEEDDILPCVCDALSQLARESGEEVEDVYCLVCGKGMDDG